MKLPPLNALRAFEATARLSSFSRAGDELHVTHAAISHHVKQLETWFGCRLFRREGARIRLTEAGEELNRHVSGTFAELARVCACIRQMRTLPVLTVACIPSIASRWLVPRLPIFCRDHPEIDLRVFYASQRQDKAAAEYDVHIATHEVRSALPRSWKLFSQASRPVCSPYYLQRHGRPGSAAEIASLDFLHDESREGWHLWFKAAGMNLVDPVPGPVFEDFNLLASAVIAGHGVALCPVDVFRDELNRGDLCALSDITVMEDRGYFIHLSEMASPIATQFRDWFLSSIQNDQASASAAAN